MHKNLPHETLHQNWNYFFFVSLRFIFVIFILRFKFSKLFTFISVFKVFYKFLKLFGNEGYLMIGQFIIKGFITLFIKSFKSHRFALAILKQGVFICL